MKAWIIRDYDNNTQVAITAIDAYNYCRKFINSLNFDSEYENELCLNELANSYSKSRIIFGVNGIIQVTTQPIINKLER